MLKKGEIIFIVLLAIWPVVPGIIGEIIARLFNCELNETSVHPCNVFGHDIGEMLYSTAMMGWGLIASVPFALVVAGVILVCKFVIKAYRKLISQDKNEK